ncbi:hypothetical protein J7W19_13965 [Streptomyces mobaraensis NBRC 13819 = DSM 40847]|uniref:Uncharacterized protein n=1 Tax=Streptomyces mobaraensis (strain ATCC 29032 / DSM 40847 / JCM 4168 / NBRC 13819 / NCIMB 11159 / IPCR 16-22) TaxID=1223523 RepID=M3C205_STRM1|nr:DUF6255 family natural product biosynthesis protein [Streptomyces mobaraensis]EME97991.1 hypothetical protein H340_23633 [Streptomyces mobaraensis NBRC 13819 = DSM 40847]QTT74367.1 hypothetical protein J7W19_13965 [Streptomyces mobaraensis NBRC 13819 = DSM 40847]
MSAGSARGVRTTTGRLVRNCAHREGWSAAPDGVRRCVSCGVERYGAYGPLRLPKERNPLTAKTGTERAAAAATAIAALGTRFLEERARLLRHRRVAVAA